MGILRKLGATVTAAAFVGIGALTATTTAEAATVAPKVAPQAAAEHTTAARLTTLDARPIVDSSVQSEVIQSLSRGLTQISPPRLGNSPGAAPQRHSGRFSTV